MSKEIVLAIFLSQFKVQSADRKFIRNFPIDDTICNFASKTPPVPQPSGSWSVIYKIVIQTEDGENVVLQSDSIM